MNALVKFERSGFTEDGLREYTFTTSSKLDLNKEKSYVINLKENRPKRSLAQNALLWEIINQICMEQDGNLKDTDIVYGQLLQMAGVEEQTITKTMTAYEMEKELRRADVRSYKILAKKVVGHKLYYHVQVFLGSSNYNTQEMSKLIDTALDYAAGLGIETNYWKELLNV